MISSIAFKYARALADVATENKQLEAAGKELIEFQKVLKQHSALYETLENPAIPLSNKRGVVEKIAPRIPLSKIVTNFILVLLENARLGQFDQVVAAYQRVMDERAGIVPVEIFSAGKLGDPVLRKLQESVAELVGKKVKLNVHQDETLIGGLKLQIGSTVFDGSIRTQLEEIQRQLSGS